MQTCLPKACSRMQFIALYCMPYPPPRPNMGQVLVQGAKVREHGVAVFGQARVTVWCVPYTPLEICPFLS